MGTRRMSNSSTPQNKTRAGRAATVPAQADPGLPFTGFTVRLPSNWNRAGPGYSRRQIFTPITNCGALGPGITPP
jgi:hypothetical protein